MQSGGFAWVWMPSEKAFVSSAIQGIVIAMVFAFIVLLIATGNFVQAGMSLVCVAIIIVWVVGIMVMKGWELGVSESISVVILIGFSVDYVIHLSADYMHSSYETRSEKIQQSYQEMGISILSGAITTFGSGAFLFGGQIITF
jgi:protein dispatched 1